MGLTTCYFVILQGFSLAVYWGGKFLTSLNGSRILESIGIEGGIDCCENTFASFIDQMIRVIFYAVFAQETQDLPHNFSQVLIQWNILSFHSLSDESEVTFLPLIVGMSHFHIFDETSLNHNLLIFKRMSPKQLYPYIEILQKFPPDSIYLDTMHLTHTFPNTLIIKDKGILSVWANTAT